jgi:hypothetical protein
MIDKFTPMLAVLMVSGILTTGCEGAQLFPAKPKYRGDVVITLADREGVLPPVSLRAHTDELAEPGKPCPDGKAGHVCVEGIGIRCTSDGLESSAPIWIEAEERFERRLVQQGDGRIYVGQEYGLSKYYRPSNKGIVFTGKTPSGTRVIISCLGYSKYSKRNGCHIYSRLSSGLAFTSGIDQPDLTRWLDSQQSVETCLASREIRSK